MKILANSRDEKINANNILIEMSLAEYHDLSRNIINNNEFQRKRVKSSSSVYNLLKNDLKSGCLIPTLFLAIEATTEKMSNDQIYSLINENKNKLIILDGLQRTYTIDDLLSELQNDIILLEKVKKNIIRIELYTGIDKLGILYRMLTLNTGQTPMSMRHQIEIIYSDYIDKPISGVTLLKEVDEMTPAKNGEYKFCDVIEGFTSFITQNYLTMDRAELLENIKNLENLSNNFEQKNLFNDFLQSYSNFVIKISELTNNWSYPQENDNYLDLNASPFAKTVHNIFSKSQCLTGFGAALGIWFKDKTIESFDELINKIIPEIRCVDSNSAIENLLKNLDTIRIRAKKIGNDQRYYFYSLFKNLFDKENEAYLNFDSAINKAMKSYERETF